MAYGDTIGLSAVMNIGGNTLWFYTSDDTHAAIKTTGYFNSVSQNIRKGDVIVASTDMDGTPGVALLAVTSADGAASVVVTDFLTST